MSTSRHSGSSCNAEIAIEYTALKVAYSDVGARGKLGLAARERLEDEDGVCPLSDLCCAPRLVRGETPHHTRSVRSGERCSRQSGGVREEGGEEGEG